MKRPWGEASYEDLVLKASHENSAGILRELIIELFHRRGQEYEELLEQLQTQFEALQTLNGISYPRIDNENLDDTDDRFSKCPMLGLLKYMGYSVGKNSPPASTRLTLLENIYRRNLLSVFSPEYMAEWGSPCSPQRRQKIIDSIESKLKMLNPFNASYAEAIEDCRVDLKYFRARC